MTDFDQLSENSRIWIFQSDRELTGKDLKLVDESLALFLQGWNTHGKELCAGYKIHEPYFIIIAVDDAQVLPSGCSIDSLTHFIQDLQEKLDVDFFQRFNIVYQDKGELFLTTAENFVEAVDSGYITSDVLIFNNLITKKSDLEDNWKASLKDSWVASRLDRNSLV